MSLMDPFTYSGSFVISDHFRIIIFCYCVPTGLAGQCPWWSEPTWFSILVLMRHYTPEILVLRSDSSELRQLRHNQANRSEGEREELQKRKQSESLYNADDVISNPLTCTTHFHDLCANAMHHIIYAPCITRRIFPRSIIGFGGLLELHSANSCRQGAGHLSSYAYILNRNIKDTKAQ